VLRIDHVVYAVGDLDEAAVRFLEAYGLGSVAGGRHERWGTANRIVPLGDQYLELVATVDPTRAGTSGFGHDVLERAADGGGWVTIAVATDDLDAVAMRLGLKVDSGSRTRPDGRVLRWRMAALDEQRRKPWMPFFLAWDVPEDLHPGRARAGHRVRPRGIAWVELVGDAEQRRSWLDGADLPIRVVEGEPGIRRVAVGSSDGEIVIE
jgi:hypothetical protein